MSPLFPQRRGRHIFRAAVISILVFGLAGLSACAESRTNLLPGDTVAEITTNLDRVRDLANSGDCSGALDAANEVSRQIESLSTAVDRRLKRSLRQGAIRLVLTIQTECQESDEIDTGTPPETELPEPDRPDSNAPDDGDRRGDRGQDEPADSGDSPDRNPPPDPGDNRQPPGDSTPPPDPGTGGIEIPGG